MFQVILFSFYVLESCRILYFFSFPSFEQTDSVDYNVISSTIHQHVGWWWADLK